MPKPLKLVPYVAPGVMLRGMQGIAVGGPVAAISACLTPHNTARSMIRSIDEAGRLRVSE